MGEWIATHLQRFKSHFGSRASLSRLWNRNAECYGMLTFARRIHRTYFHRLENEFRDNIRRSYFRRPPYKAPYKALH